LSSDIWGKTGDAYLFIDVHSADDWRSVLGPVVARYRDADIRGYFRGDAAFANPAIYTFLEEEAYLYRDFPYGGDRSFCAAPWPRWTSQGTLDRGEAGTVPSRSLSVARLVQSPFLR